MKINTEQIKTACDYLREKIVQKPEILVMAGTGLGGLSDVLENQITVEYSEIPGFPGTTVESHAGELIFGKIGNRAIALMSGRFHLYEGYTPDQIVFPIRVMQDLGAGILIITNASGGINPNFQEGGIMLIEDHINLTGQNPLIGPNDEARGLRFPDMIHAYDKNLRYHVEEVAQSRGVRLFKGVYAGLSGPSLETPAEIRFLKIIGADSVGLSTIMEVITAVHGGMSVLGLSAITNINDPDNPEPATLEGVVAVAEKTAPVLSDLIQKTIERLNDDEM